MTRTSRLVLYAAVALIALVGGYFVHLWSQPDAPPQDAAKVLMLASLDDLQGRKQPLSQWQGKVMVVNFWATWCPPCLKEIPEFVRMQSAYQDRGVQFLGLAIDDRAKVASFVARMGMNYPVLMAQEEGLNLARDAGNRLGGLPFTVIIDRHGRAAHIELGVLNEQKLGPMLDKLL